MPPIMYLLKPMPITYADIQANESLHLSDDDESDMWQGYIVDTACPSHTFDDDDDNHYWAVADNDSTYIE